VPPYRRSPLVCGRQNTTLDARPRMRRVFSLFSDRQKADGKAKALPLTAVGEGPSQGKSPSLALAREGLLAFECPSYTTPFPRRGSYGLAEAGNLASITDQIGRYRYSCGTAPDLDRLPPFVPLASGLWGTSTMAVFDCGVNYSTKRRIVKLDSVADGVGE
jgi:hypothetical protein